MMNDVVSRNNVPLSLEVTSECNLKCLHCFARGRTAESATLSQEIAMEIISEGFELAYRRLHLTGGEPFLWDSLFGFVDFEDPFLVI